LRRELFPSWSVAWRDDEEVGGRPPFSLFLFFSLFRSPFDLFGTALLLDAAELGCRVEYPPLSVGGVSRLGWDSSWEDRGETLLLEEWMEVWEGDGERGFVPS
jgi:hypothetical protein